MGREKVEEKEEKERKEGGISDEKGGANGRRGGECQGEMARSARGRGGSQERRGEVWRGRQTDGDWSVSDSNQTTTWRRVVCLARHSIT